MMQPRPLHTRLSSRAPREAKIISRTPTSAIQPPSYTLQVGGVTIPDVGLDEIFDFVSQRDYEEFEHAAFRRDVEERDARTLKTTLLRGKLGRPRGSKAKQAVTNPSEPTGSTTSLDSQLPVAIQPPVEVGRHGRPRPTYTHLYKRGRGGRARGGSRPTRGEFKARGRGRPRREEQEHDRLSEAASVLSLDDEPLKRRRIDAPSLSPIRANTPCAADRTPSPTPATSSSPPGPRATPSAPIPIPPSSGAKRGNLAALPPDTAQLSYSSSPSSVVSSSSSLSSSAYDTSALRRRTAPKKARPKPRPGHSSASEAEAPRPAPDSGSDDDDDDDDSAYEVEQILTHRLSDPGSHPPELGQKPIMLYHVKWIGYDETTWEPVGSFDDQRVVRAYWARIKGEGKS